MQSIFTKNWNVDLCTSGIELIQVDVVALLVTLATAAAAAVAVLLVTVVIAAAVEVQL